MTETGVRSTHVWTDEKAVLESLVALDENSIFVASPDESKIVDIAEQIRSGTPPVAALKGSKAQQIQIDALRCIKSNRYSTVVGYKVSGENGKDQPGSFTMKREQRDDLFAKLNVLCSRGFKYTETQFTRLRAVVAPLITMGVVAVLTLVSHGAAVEMAAGETAKIRGRHALAQRLFVWAIEILRPTGVLVVGGLIAVLCLVWMVKRVGTPPLMLEYKKAG